MIVLSDMVSIPTRSLLVDLASRTSHSQEDELTMCPYAGLKDDKNVINFSKKLDRPLALLFKETPVIRDYSVASSKPVSGPWYQKDNSKIEDYLTRLEDIDKTWIYKYFSNSIPNLIKSLSRDMDVNRDFEVPKSFLDEEGSIQSPGDFIVDEGFTTDTYRYKDRLGYILKMFLEKSVSTGVHMFSLARAYYIVDTRNKKNQLSKYPGIEAMQGEGIYNVDKNGKVTNRVIGAYRPGPEKDALAMVRRKDNVPNGFNDLIDEFLYICESLNINLEKENPKDYDSDFINKLIIIHIKSNRDYIISSKKDANKKVLKTLDSLSVRDYGKIIDREISITFKDIIIQTADKFKFSDVITKEKRGVDKIPDMQNLVYNIGRIENKGLYLPQVPTQDGFFMKNQQDYYTINVKKIIRGYQSIQALLHTSGYLVLITSGLNMVYIDVDLASEYVDAVSIGDENKNYIQYGGNKCNLRFGGWLESMI